MARAVWSGVLSFGLVSVPVELYTATEEHGPVFHQFQKGTADRIRYQRVNERTGDEVEYSDIVKGADIGGGNYVLLDQDELDSVAPGRSRLMDIHTFVEAARKRSGGTAPAKKPDRKTTRKTTGPRKTARKGSGRSPAA
jgi:DNA end-binding protein Ku